MKIGQLTKHKLSGELMTIKKINKHIAVCKRKIPIGSEFGYDIYTAICDIKNLEPE